MIPQESIQSRLKGPSIFTRNIDAALYGALEGLPYDLFLEKISRLPAESDYSQFTVGDYIEQLNALGKISLEEEGTVLRIVDPDLRRQTEKRREIGRVRLEEIKSC